MPHICSVPRERTFRRKSESGNYSSWARAGQQQIEGGAELRALRRLFAARFEPGGTIQVSGAGVARARAPPPSSGPKERHMEPVIREIIGPDLAHGFLESLTALAEVNLTFEEAAEVLRA